MSVVNEGVSGWRGADLFCSAGASGAESHLKYSLCRQLRDAPLIGLVRSVLPPADEGGGQSAFPSSSFRATGVPQGGGTYSTGET